MSGRVEKDRRAAGDVISNIPADMFARDDVVSALQDQCASRDFRQIRAVVGCERRACKLECDPRIGLAEALRQFWPSSG
jgi:hypothetical protein